MVTLERRSVRDITWWTDPALDREGLVFGFTERLGGVSAGPYSALNLASHVGDDPSCVNENRDRLLDALGLATLRDRLVIPEQVHGERIELVGPGHCGAGAFAGTGRPPLSGTDAVVIAQPGIPVLLCFADCVPIILVAPGPACAVVHAGWRGALGSLPGKSAVRLADIAACSPAQIHAYVGPHIRACHYEVGEDVLSQFCNSFGTLARASSGGLDLEHVVSASLRLAGVDQCNITSLGTCTAETTDRFFSYRAEGGLTGRHSAFACITPSSR